MAYPVSFAVARGAAFSLSEHGGGGVIIPRNALFGVNLSGAEFAPWNGQTWPSAADATYLASKGVGFVRLPIAWESIQPTLGAALDTTYLNGLKDTIALLKAKGISTIVELHNFGYYITQSKWIASDGVVSGYAGNAAALATGVNVLGDGTLTSAHLVDLWTRLATELTGTAGVIGFGVMNEPAPGIVGTNKLDAPNYFGNSSGSKPWVVLNAANPTKLADGTNPLGAAYGPAWDISSGTGFGGVQQSVVLPAAPVIVSCYVKCASGTEAGAFGIGGSFGGFTATTTWQRKSYTRTPSAGANAVLISLSSASGHTIQIANAQIELGATATTYEPSPAQSYVQAAIDAIRGVDAEMPIYICGYNFSLASRWLIYNYELAALTGGNLIFEAHQYFDGAQGVGGGGAYSGSYASYGITGTSGAEAVASYLDWCSAQEITGFMGEFGVPADEDWQALQVTFLGSFLAAGVKGTQWFYGNNGIQPSNSLNIAAADDARLTQMLAVK